MTWSPFPGQPPLTPPPAAAAAPVPGTVYLVGAGPGDPDLMTVRGLRCLRRAGVVLYDRLIHPSLLDEAPQGAQRIFVGKARGRPGLGQAAIHRLLIEHARRGQVVVRLKGGDPFVFGRGSEEAEALAAAGVPWEVVPAASSAFAVPALAGIPLTHRRLARGFAVVTGHQAAGGREPDWAALAAIDTVVVLMGLAELATIAARLVEHGRDPATPAAVIARGTLPDERVVVARLDEIALRVAEQDVRSPATLVVGEVVGLREVLRESPLQEKSPPAPLFQRGEQKSPPAPLFQRGEQDRAASPLFTGA